MSETLEPQKPTDVAVLFEKILQLVDAYQKCVSASAPKGAEPPTPNLLNVILALGGAVGSTAADCLSPTKALELAAAQAKLVLDQTLRDRAAALTARMETMPRVDGGRLISRARH